MGDAANSLQFKTSSSSLTLKICLAIQPVAGFPATPAELTALLTGTPNWAILADGDLNALTSKQMTISTTFTGLTADQIAAKKIVAYTAGPNGTWVRTVLASTQSAGTSGVAFTAPFTAAGLYTIE